MPDNMISRDGKFSLVAAIRISDRLIGVVEKVLLVGVCLAMTILMFLISADAICRYFFNAPFAFTYDSVLLYFLPVAMFFAFSYTFRQGGHVAVEILATRLPPRVYELVMAIMLTLSAVLILILLERSIYVTVDAYTSNDWLGGAYPMPVWVSKAIVPVGIGVFALRLTHAVIANLFAAVTGCRGIAYPAAVPLPELGETEGSV